MMPWLLLYSYSGGEFRQGITDSKSPPGSVRIGVLAAQVYSTASALAASPDGKTMFPHNSAVDSAQTFRNPLHTVIPKNDGFLRGFFPSLSLTWTNVCFAATPAGIPYYKSSHCVIKCSFPVLFITNGCTKIDQLCKSS